MKKKLSVVTLSLLVATSAFANEQYKSQGFIDDSHLDLFLRNTYIHRDYNEGVKNKAEWGQGFIATYTSGFTQGPIGVGVDGISQYAFRLDGGRGRSGAGGIDLFSQDNDGRAKDDIFKFGATAKMRFSNTVISYGSQRPALPIINADDSRLLYETFTGTMLTSNEIDGLNVNAGYFTDEQRKSDDSHNSGLKSISFGGGNYQFNDQFRGAIYASHVEDALNKQYLGLNFVQPINNNKVTLDFNGYNSRLDQDYAQSLDTGRSNTIWSLAASYIFDIHTVKFAFQQSSGSTGYNYGGYRNQGGVGDGGNTIWLSNSYWSDFNAEDERSWQIAYGIDFGGLGLPGLTWNTAWVRGDDIKTSTSSNGHEREFFNQLQYEVQNGKAKGLKLRLRYSILHVSNEASEYMIGGDEFRAYVEYPLNIL